MALDYEITDENQIDIPYDLRNTILDICAWKIPPRFPYPSRTAWWPIPKELQVRHSRQLLSGVKLKGVGYFGGENKFNEDYILHSEGSKPPSSVEYKLTAQIPHIGMSLCGEIITTHSEPAPLGAILHRRARREFRNAMIFAQRQQAALIPWLVVKYTGVKYFNNEPLGAVILLSPNHQPFRLHHLLDDSLSNTETRSDYLRTIEFCKDENKLPVSAVSLAKAINKIGVAMRNFSLAGLYRYSGGWDNFQYCPSTRNVFPVDFDSTCELVRAEKPNAYFHILRDGASVLHKTLKAIYAPPNVANFNIKSLTESKLLESFMTGYFPEAQESTVARASRIIWDCFLPHFEMIRSSFCDQHMSCSGIRDRNLRLDNDLFQIVSILAMFPLLKGIKREGIAISLPSYELLKKKAQTFLGPRFDYLLWIIEKNGA